MYRVQKLAPDRWLSGDTIEALVRQLRDEPAGTRVVLDGGGLQVVVALEDLNLLAAREVETGGNVNEASA